MGSIQVILDDLSQVSLEFVNSKLVFLQKYSQSLKPSQLEARHHRNNQIRNLIEYVKLHKRAKIKSVLHSPVKKLSEHIKHRPKYSFNETALQSAIKNCASQPVLTHSDEAKVDLSMFEAKATLRKENVKHVLHDLINR